MKDYHINIFYSDADNGYIADIPDLEACSAFRKTPTDALKQAQLAKKVWLEAAQVVGELISKQHYRSAIYRTSS
jgi:predicted RNase H-like HicB family nuclease